MVRKLSTRSPIEVEDEETKQTKAWRWAFSHLRVRGDLEAELAHSLWNSMKAALRITLPDKADLHTSLLKLSIACNHSHGSFLSGDRAIRMRECLQEWLQRKDENWFAEFTEDMGRGRADCTNETPLVTFDEIMNSHLIKSKGRFATCHV